MNKAADVDPPLAGKRVIVIEDDFFIMDDLCQQLKLAGAMVAGRASSIEGALALVEAVGQDVDAALLNIDIDGNLAYPVADALRARSMPFVFVTGHDDNMVLGRYADVPMCQKPVQSAVLVRSLKVVIRS